MRLLVMIFALILPTSAQWLNITTAGVPRTEDGKPNLTAPTPKAPDGKPDLSGIWRFIPGTGATNIGDSFKPGEIQPWAVALHKERKENLGRDVFSVTCLPAGPLFSLAGAQDGVRIVQTPSLIAILYSEMAFRQIHLDGRKLPENPSPTWMGYSIGHWDGDTLVVETNGFNDRTWLDFEGHPHSEALRMTERFKRTDFGHMEIAVTFEDPKVYARPITIPTKAEIMVDTEMLEYVCNENEKDLPHLVGKASDDKIVEVSPEILSKYLGTYEATSTEIPLPDGKLTFEIVLKDGKKLVMDTPFGSMPLDAISETMFLSGGASMHFDEKDGVMAMILRIVEGDLRAVRIKK